MSENVSLTDFMETLDRQAQGDAVSIGDVVESFEQRGFGPLLLAPALIALLPTGAIPGIPTACAILICLIDSQRLFGLKYPWVPKRLRQISIKRNQFEAALRKAKPITQRIDRFIYSRYNKFIEPPADLIVAALTIMLALTMIPLEMLPFAAAIPALSIVLFAVGLTANDGLLVMIGLIASAIAAIVGVIWFY